MFQGFKEGDELFHSPPSSSPPEEIQDENSLIAFETNEVHGEDGTTTASGLTSIPKKKKRGNKKQNLNAFSRTHEEEDYVDEDTDSTFHYKNHTFVASRGVSSVKSRSNHFYNHHHQHHHQHKYHYYTRPKTKEEYVLAK